MSRLSESLSANDNGYAGCYRVPNHEEENHRTDHNTLHRKANQTFDVIDYGATGDGVTDDSSAIQAAIDAAGETGGIVFFPPGIYRADSQLRGPTYDASSPWATAPVTLRGSGSDAFSGITSTRDPSGGTILDLRYTTGPACFVLKGSGRVTIEGITFWQDGTAHTNPYLFISNTVAHISQCSFFGHNTKSGTGCDQDAIILGGLSEDYDDSDDARFQGYGTVIERNHFNRIEGCVRWQSSANGTVVRDNNVWKECGGNAAFELVPDAAGSATGNTIAFNLIEMPNYVYGIHLADNANRNMILFNSFWDFGGGVLAPVIIDDGAIRNVVFMGFHTTGVDHVIDNGAGTASFHNNGNGLDPWVIPQTFIFTDDSAATFDGPTSFNDTLRGTRAGDAVANSEKMLEFTRSSDESTNPDEVVALVNYGGSLYLGGDDAHVRIFAEDGTEKARIGETAGRFWRLSGAGGGMEINSGTGGSYLTLQNYGLQLKDHTGSNALYIRNGTGTPEGSYTAPVGSLFLRTDGGTGTTLYVKETGTGNTGWVAK